MIFNKFLSSILLSIVLFGCSKDIPIIKDLSKTNFKLIDQNSKAFNFPQDLKGKNVILSYIYTNCSDICPFITQNIIEIKKQIDKERIADIEYVEITFDPERDSPSVLKKYADVRGIKSKDNFHFLTGDKKTIYRLLNAVNYRTMLSDTTITQNGDTLYYFIHTDRISLIDKKGRLRKNFKGSNLNKKELIDIIKLLD